MRKVPLGFALAFAIFSSSLAQAQSYCDPGYVVCDNLCIPAGTVCCHDGAHYCDSGVCCSDGLHCAASYSACSGGGSGGSGGSSGSGGTGGGSCPSGQVGCDDGCIPSGATCCHDNAHYCDSGVCCPDGNSCATSYSQCSGGSGGSAGSSGSGGSGGSSGSSHSTGGSLSSGGSFATGGTISTGGTTSNETCATTDIGGDDCDYVSSCCNESGCWYVADGKKFDCGGYACGSAAQRVVDYCTPASPSYSDDSEDDESSGCAVSPTRSAGTPALLLALAGVVSLGLRRRRKQH